MPWRTTEDGTRSFIVWADLLVAPGAAVENVVGQLMRSVAQEHRVVGWEYSGSAPAGTELEVELIDETEDTAVRSSLLRLANDAPEIQHLELLDSDPLDQPPDL